MLADRVKLFICGALAGSLAGLIRGPLGPRAVTDGGLGAVCQSGSKAVCVKGFGRNVSCCDPVSRVVLYGGSLRCSSVLAFYRSADRRCVCCKASNAKLVQHSLIASSCRGVTAPTGVMISLSVSSGGHL